jgi:hypothetical protein
MDPHRLLVDVRLQGIEVIRKWGEFVSHLFYLLFHCAWGPTPTRNTRFARRPLALPPVAA